MEGLLRLLSGPWTTYLLYILQRDGPQRFLALKRAIPGISARLLTDRLRRLEEAGLVWRRVEPTRPPRVTYGLTDKGLELRAALTALEAVAIRWQAQETGGKDQ
ncbi:MAG: transcriptional regulator [Alphaproteobacteria bacterium]|nr:MAG: transcriptional regulator [Alphaproteobacteria bacterium]